MTRKIIQIDEEKCVGCGLCANACQQAAIEIIDGKAKVVRDDYCDGIGNCLPVCPVDAISFSDQDIKNNTVNNSVPEVNQWPIQMKLVSPEAPYFDNANLLVAADCTAFSYGKFHSEFMKHKITLIGCPKLDEGDYTDKLTDIIANNNIKSVTVIRMNVPCCKGIEHAVKNALIASKKMIPWQVVTISTEGNILD